MIQITFDMGGVEVVKQQFATYGADVSDLTPAWTEIADDVQAQFALNMASEGAVFGHGWAPLQPNTIAERVRKGYGAGPILWRTGELGQSLSGDGGMAIKEVTPTSMTVGTSVPYATYHQTGTKKMPQRKIIGLSFAARSQVVRVLADYIRLLAAKAGLG